MLFKISASLFQLYRRISRRTVVVAAIALLIVSILLVICTFYSGEEEKETSLKVISDKVDLHIRDVNYTEVDEDGSVWEITADTASFSKKDNVAYFDNVKLKLTLKDGRTYEMTGTKGMMHTDNHDARIEGNVKIVSGKGDVFTTDHLNYLEKEKKIFTEGGVNLSNSRLEISGVGLTILTDSDRVVLHDRVRAIVR
jgi:LPS export ABC transporter protein LptC